MHIICAWGEILAVFVACVVGSVLYFAIKGLFGAVGIIGIVCCIVFAIISVLWFWELHFKYCKEDVSEKQFKKQCGR